MRCVRTWASRAQHHGDGGMTEDRSRPKPFNHSRRRVYGPTEGSWWANDEALAEKEEDPRTQFSKALQRRGVTPILSRLIARDNAAWQAVLDGEPLEDVAERVCLEDLMTSLEFDSDGYPGADEPDLTKDPEVLAIVRKQATYARKLYINYKYLRRNLDRNVDRLTRRRNKRYRPRRRRPHYSLGTLLPKQRQEAEQIWKSGACHGLTLHQAIYVSARDNPAVYRRVHRVLNKALEMST